MFHFKDNADLEDLRYMSNHWGMTFCRLKKSFPRCECLCPPSHSYVEILMSSVVVLGRGGLWEVIRSLHRALMNEINDLIKDSPECWLAPGRDGEVSSLQPGSQHSPEPGKAGTLILDFQLPET